MFIKFIATQRCKLQRHFLPGPEPPPRPRFSQPPVPRGVANPGPGNFYRCGRTRPKAGRSRPRQGRGWAADCAIGARSPGERRSAAFPAYPPIAARLIMQPPPHRDDCPPPRPAINQRPRATRLRHDFFGVRSPRGSAVRTTEAARADRCRRQEFSVARCDFGELRTSLVRGCRGPPSAEQEATFSGDFCLNSV